MPGGRRSDSQSMSDRPQARTVEQLHVFHLAHNLVLRVYALTQDFPSVEKFGLVAQMRRAAASIPANLIEGGARQSRAEYRQFVGVARGSTAEMRYHLLLSRDLGYLREPEYETVQRDYDRIARMLTRLSQALRT
jgi:four helix bundle protein